MDILFILCLLSVRFCDKRFICINFMEILKESFAVSDNVFILYMGRERLEEVVFKSFLLIRGGFIDVFEFLVGGFNFYMFKGNLLCRIVYGFNLL